MSASATFYTVNNLQNDSVALSLSLRDALTKTNTADVKQAWIDTAVNSAKIVSGIAYLAANDPRWASIVGTTSTLASIGVSANRIKDSLTADNSIYNVKAADLLSVVGGISDLAGNVLLKPGPSFVPGVVLKGVGLGAGVAQNLLPDDTVGQVLNRLAGSNTPVISPSSFPVIRYAPDGVTPLGVSIPFVEGNTRTNTIWFKDDRTGNYLKLEKISTVGSDGTTLSVIENQYKYSTDNRPLSLDVLVRDGSGAIVGGASSVISADGKTWLVVGSATPDTVPGTVTPPAPIKRANMNRP